MTARVYVKGEGDPNTRVLMLGEAPGELEVARGRVFVGPSGVELNSNLHRIGLRRSDIYIDNIIPYHLPGNRNPTSAEVDGQMGRLSKLLERINPDIICTLGRFATRVFLPEVDMDAVHGVPIKWRRRVVFPMYHPAFGLHEPNNMKFVHYDFDCLQLLLRGRICALDMDEGRDYDYIEITGDKVPLDDVIAIDTEWASGAPWCISCSISPNTGYMIYKDNKAALARVAAHVRKRSVITALHNAMYDLPVLQSLGIVPRRFDDSMVAAYLLQVEPQGLKPLAFRYKGIKMTSYMETVGGAGVEKALLYLSNVVSINWPDPDPVLEFKAGKWRIKNPWNVRKRVWRILDDYRKDNSIDVRKRFLKIGVDEGRGLIEKELGPIPEGDLSDVDRGVAVRYACQDADATRQIREPILNRIDAMGLMDVYKCDIGMLPLACDIQTGGVRVDLGKLSKLNNWVQDRMEAIEGDVDDYFGSHVVLSSYASVSAALFDLGVFKSPKTSSRADVLKAHEHKHPVVPLIREWRMFAKMKSSYIDVLPGAVDADGRARPTVRITRTETGRMSMTDPALMTLPQRDADARKVKGVITAPPGCLLVESDYKQIEMKVAAHESRDETMLSFFRSGGDVHTATAAKMWGIDEQDVEKIQRYAAKRVGFGILMKITAYGLHREFIANGIVDFSESDCDDMIREWYRVYSGIKKWTDWSERKATMDGYVRDMFGRIRYIPQLRSPDKWIREKGLKRVINGKVQMGAQGIIKRGMMSLVPVYRSYRGSGVTFNPILQVHDALVFEVSKSTLEECVGHIEYCMENAVELVLPTTVSTDVGPDLESMSEYNK